MNARWVVRGALAASLVSGFFLAASAETDALLYPNLQTEAPSGVRLDVTDVESGDGVTMHKVVRFTNSVRNVGAGPLQMLGVTVGTPPNQQTKAIQEVLYASGAAPFEHVAGQFVFHPEHAHWHFEDFARYELRKAVDASNPTAAANEVVAANGKVTFCIIDVTKLKGYPDPNQPKRPVYASCGQERQGISVGWSDEYGYWLFEQWIDLEANGVGDGTYWLCSTADPSNKLLESNDGDNAAYTRIEISRGVTRVRADR